MKHIGDTPVLKGTKFREVFADPDTIGSTLITLIYCRSDIKRVGFAVKSGTAKNSVVRNKLKRQMREAFVKTESLFPEGKHYVFMMKKKPGEFSFSSLLEEFERLGNHVKDSK